MIHIEQGFCHVCGRKFQMCYPFNDPENGPARMGCHEHSRIDEEPMIQDRLTRDWLIDAVDEKFGYGNLTNEWSKELCRSLTDAAKLIIRMCWPTDSEEFLQRLDAKYQELQRDPAFRKAMARLAEIYEQKEGDEE